jgi:hypothetical protein
MTMKVDPLWGRNRPRYYHTRPTGGEQWPRPLLGGIEGFCDDCKRWVPVTIDDLDLDDFDLVDES